MLNYIAFSLIVISINFYIKKKNFFLINKLSEHQKFLNSNIPLVGGFYLIFPILFFLYDISIVFFFISILIFILGVFSDLNILSSPKKRFFIQLFLIFLFVFFEKLQVLPTRINIIDKILLDTNWSYFFTIFCLLILMNGSNFIDGLNGLLLGYVFIILFIIFKLDLFIYLEIEDKNIIFLLYAFSLILVLNFLNQLFLGDSGAYFLSFFVGYILIKIYNFNVNISPYFIILLLWYPCYENLFSIIRKLIKEKSPLNPDNEHLHQYLYTFIKSKFYFGSLKSNIISSLIINFLNFIFLYIGSTNPNDSKLQLNLILFLTIIYILKYIILRKLCLGFTSSKK